MNVGWYVVYLLMIAINSVANSINGYTIGSWQFWLSLGLLMMCYIAGQYVYK